jgi:hypothetical protein
MKVIRFVSTLAATLLCSWTAMAGSSTVVISQVYGGGGATSGSPTYKYDYVELFNKSASAVDLSGYSLQYASASGGFTSVYAIPAGTTIQPGHYLFASVSSAGTAGGDFPISPDLTATSLNMAAGSGKVALANITTSLGTVSSLPDARIIDEVAYGAANLGEGGTTVNSGTALANTQGCVRKSLGCQDNDNNASDFDVVTGPVPRNSASSANNCGGTGPTGFVRVETKADGTGVLVPAQSLVAGNSITVYAISRDANSNFVSNIAADSWTAINKTGTVAAGDLVPSGDLKSAVFTGHGAGNVNIHVSSGSLTSTDSGVITVTATTPSQVRVETAADGSGTVVPADIVVPGQSVTMYAIRRDAYTNFVDNVAATAWSLSTKTGSVADGDLVPSADKKSATFVGNGEGSATVRATSSALTTVDSGVLTVTPVPKASVVISQVYGGGGNSGSIYVSDYVELFNRTATPVSLNGWSIQYGSSAGAFQASTAAALPNVSIPANSYFLIQLFTTNAAGNAIPTADFVATNINMSATAGKVALANTTNALGTITWPDSHLVDMVGYGGASVYEGAGSAPAPANGTALVRNSTGCSDTDNNSVDFTTTASPNPHNTSSGTSVCAPQPPNISGIANQSVDASAPVGPISFNVSDQETAAASLTVSASSSNPTLLPNANISLGGSGVVRTVTLNPVSGQTGSAQVTIIVTDTDNMQASTTFSLFVGSGPQVGMLFYDNFDQYSDGTQLSLLGDSGSGAWFHTGGTFYEMTVSNSQAQVCLNPTNSEDIYGAFTNVASAGAGTVLYVGFKVTQTVLPTANGEYFLHLKDNTTSNFFCRVFASTANAAAGKFRLGLSNKAGNPPNVQFPRDLDLNTTYNVVARYKVGVGVSTLWVDPTSINDTNVTATDPVSAPLDISAVALRETGSFGNNAAAGSQSIDNLAVSTSFTDVVTIAPQPPAITATRSASSITLTWPVSNGAGFTLQTASTVNSTTWTTVAGVTTSGGNYTVTIPYTSSPAFFRLKK